MQNVVIRTLGFSLFTYDDRFYSMQRAWHRHKMHSSLEFILVRHPIVVPPFLTTVKLLAIRINTMQSLAVHLNLNFYPS